MKCTCCTEHGIRTLTSDELLKLGDGDYDRDTGLTPFDFLLEAPPWRDLVGGGVTFHRGHLRGFRVWSEPYGPPSATAYEAEVKRWRETRAAGALWDDEAAAEMEWRHELERRRARKVRVTATVQQRRMYRAPDVEVVRGRIRVR
jgi:hypothetical protein